jgi:hypothetical protein
MPGYRAGRPPSNKGVRYPADPPTVEEIIAVMSAAGDRPHGCRLHALIVILWRAAHEALALAEGDLDPRRGALLVRRGRGGRCREVGMDSWVGMSSSRGSSSACSSLSARCCACSTVPPAAASGRVPLREPIYAAPPRTPESGDASRRRASTTPRSSKPSTHVRGTVPAPRGCVYASGWDESI